MTKNGFFVAGDNVRGYCIGRSDFHGGGLSWFEVTNGHPQESEGIVAAQDAGIDVYRLARNEAERLGVAVCGDVFFWACCIREHMSLLDFLAMKK